MHPENLPYLYGVYCVLNLHQNEGICTDYRLYKKDQNLLLFTMTAAIMDFSSNSEADEKEHDPVIDLAIDYLVNGKYTDGLSKEKSC